MPITSCSSPHLFPMRTRLNDCTELNCSSCLSWTVELVSWRHSQHCRQKPTRSQRTWSPSNPLKDMRLTWQAFLIAQLVNNPPASARSAGEGIGYPLQYSWASLVAQLVKILPVMWETWVRSLDWEDLEKGKATHSSILAWRIPWTQVSHFHFHFST